MDLTQSLPNFFLRKPRVGPMLFRIRVMRPILINRQQNNRHLETLVAVNPCRCQPLSLSTLVAVNPCRCQPLSLLTFVVVNPCRCQPLSFCQPLSLSTC
jgi:hypothetical protein